MESPRTSFALGPVEISLRRNGEGPRVGMLGSLVVHVLVIAVLLVAVPDRKIAVEAEFAPTTKSPIPMTFVDPLPQLPRPQRDELASRIPPPVTRDKPLPMQSVPEIVAPPTIAPKQTSRESPGRRDVRPAGGEAGGPIMRPSPGTPPPEADVRDASGIDERKDLLGRLREFKQAVETPQPASAQGHSGGGTGRGGITMPALPPTGFGIGNLEFEGRDYDWESYGRQIHGIIWRAWHNRLWITSSVFEKWASEQRTWFLEHRSAVRFTILKSGQVVDVAIETPSGCYALDDSATDALREVVLPPLPEDFQRDSETVHARFIAEGGIRGMKEQLQRMKDAGFF